MYKKYLAILGLSLFFFMKTISIHAADYEYDDLGRVTKTVYEDGSSVTYTYDANGNIVEMKVDAEDGDDRGDEEEQEDKNGQEDKDDGEDKSGQENKDNTEDKGGSENKGNVGEKGNPEDKNGLENINNAEDKDANKSEEKNVSAEREATAEFEKADQVSEGIADDKEKGENSGTHDKEDKVGSGGGKLAYMVLACMASGAAAAIYLKKKQKRDQTKPR